ncbi:hypothetical protein JXM67_14555 [candidate division WOR-3 bacterium]|nr:hypothetical protein [candidate division WOR-3 bacterium]
MKYKVWYDETHSILRYSQTEPLNAEDIREAISITVRLAHDTKQRRLLVDLSEGPTDMLDKEARKVLGNTPCPTCSIR